MTGTCVRIGCNNPIKTRGLCPACYEEIRREIARHRRVRRARAALREETPVAPTAEEAMAWIDYAQLQAAIDDPTTPDYEWSKNMACTRTPTNMFPTEAYGVVKAKKVCEGCPSVYPCLAYALIMHGESTDFGVFGGTSTRERNRIRKRRLVRVVSRQHVSIRGGYHA